MTILYLGTSQRRPLHASWDKDTPKFIPRVEVYTPTASSYLNEDGDQEWQGHMRYGSVTTGHDSEIEAIEAAIRWAKRDGFSENEQGEKAYAQKEAKARCNKLFRHAGPNKTKLPNGMSLREFIEAL